jgi:hypothetical protein
MPKFELPWKIIGGPDLSSLSMAGFDIYEFLNFLWPEATVFHPVNSATCIKTFEVLYTLVCNLM